MKANNAVPRSVSPAPEVGHPVGSREAMLQNAAARGQNDAFTLTIRELLRYWDVERRTPEAVSKILADLDDHGLVTVPPLTDVWIDSTVKLRADRRATRDTPSRSDPKDTRSRTDYYTEGSLKIGALADVTRSRRFYVDIFDGQAIQDENPCVVRIANSWIIMNPGGGPTPDKPGVTLTTPERSGNVSAFLNMRVADIAAFYEHARSKGAEFLTEPLDRKAEIRCYLRDPDGYLIEIGQATGILHGAYADPPASTS